MVDVRLRDGLLEMVKQKLVPKVDLVTISATIILVAFFLPWVRYGGSYTGYEIPDIARIAAKATSFKAWTGRFDINVYLVYLLYLVPIGALAILVLSAVSRPLGIVAMIVAAMPLAGFVYGIFSMGFKLFSHIGIGGWLTIVAAAVMALALAGIIQMPGKLVRRR